MSLFGLGVAFMVALLFLLLIMLERVWEAAGQRFQELTGKPRQQVADPAELVGTFSRYK